MNVTETERRNRQAAVWSALEIQRVRECHKSNLKADRLWTMRINAGGFKRSANSKIIQVKGVDCYA